VKNEIVKYSSVTFLVSFFIFITIVGLRDAGKPTTGHTHFHAKVVEPEPFVLVDDIIFEVFAEEMYD
jgi:hypothetical protein